MAEKLRKFGKKGKGSKARKPRKWLRRLLVWGSISAVTGLIVAVGAVFWAFAYYGSDLPDYRHLKKYEPAVITRTHAGDGSLLTEFAREKRLFMPIDSMPQELLQAFISAEDKNFYDHTGLDYLGIVRAALTNVANVTRGRRLVGASTITQQVARNFLLTLDQKFDRKIKEMIITLRMERAFSKDEILELYLNEIYLGGGSYGVASAALHYFNKSLDELTIAEMAYLAALPKGPNNYHPVRKKARAIGRRNWVLSRMLVLGYIDQATHDVGVAEDLLMRARSGHALFRGEYFGETVRRKIQKTYGNASLYEGGLSVHTSLEPRLQAAAEVALRRGLHAYDRRHGWRGPLGHIAIGDDWAKSLAKSNYALGITEWESALVLNLAEEGALIGFKDGSFGFIPLAEVTWARNWLVGERIGSKVKDIGQVLNIGDIIVVEHLAKAARVDITSLVFEDIDFEPMAAVYALRQIPAVEGALVVMDPHTGRVLAMVGGFDYQTSQFNRAEQAERQPGSAFKPFVYTAALESGFTPSSLVLDAPFVIDQGEGLGKWKPKNSSNKVYGPSTLRLGLEKSRNLMTVRLAQNIGMRKIINHAGNFGLAKNMQPHLAMSLGAGEVSLLQLTAGYSMLVNGGKEIIPSLIDRVQDRRGKTIYRHDERRCLDCDQTWDLHTSEPTLSDNRKQVVDSRTAYQIVSMLEGVVQRGTGRKIRVLGRPLAGKTGTTNDAADAWFVGFSPDLTVGVFVGFDRPRSLGRFEEGSSVAVPIFRDFMKVALKDAPKIPFRIPEGVRLVRINAKTGLPARIGDKNVILEAYIPGTEPRVGQLAVLDGSLPIGEKEGSVRRGSGGIY